MRSSVWLSTTARNVQGTALIDELLGDGSKASAASQWWSAVGGVVMVVVCMCVCRVSACSTPVQLCLLQEIESSCEPYSVCLSAL